MSQGVRQDIIVRKYGKRSDFYHIKNARVPGEDSKARYRRVMSEAKKCLPAWILGQEGTRLPPVVGVSARAIKIKDTGHGIPIVLWLHRKVKRDEMEAVVDRLAEMFAA